MDKKEMALQLGHSTRWKVIKAGGMGGVVGASTCNHGEVATKPHSLYPHAHMGRTNIQMGGEHGGHVMTPSTEPSAGKGHVCGIGYRTPIAVPM